MIKKTIIFVILILTNETAFSQIVNQEEFKEHIGKFEEYFEKGKYKKAAKSFEWLFTKGAYKDQDFFQNGMLLYDYLYASENNDNRARHYKQMLDTLTSITDQRIEEVLIERFEDHGYHEESEDITPIVTVIPDVIPEYSDGLQAFYATISKQVRFPEVLKKYNIESKVFVGFVVDRDGKVLSVEMVKGINTDVDQKIINTV
ncbi:MAG: hypothetical protein AAF223_20635, partial [Bacteroidota bacterium]